MKHYRTIVLLSCLLSALGASADLVMSTMTLRNTVGGVTSSITAKMQVDDGRTDGNLYDQNGQRLIRCATGCTGQDGTLTIPSAVTAIVPGAFAGCDNLAVVDLRQTSTAWRFDRQTDASPFFNASRYTLFILNDNATATAQEPNVVYKDGGNYECDELQLTDRMGLNSPVTFAAASTYYDRPFAPSMRLAPSESEGV